MDIKEYIESGIIESYVLGFASPQEIREVECLSAIYPEIKNELTLQQTNVEKFVETISVNPPSELKEQIFAKIKDIKQESHLTMEKKEEDKVVTPKSNSWIKYVAAASVIGLIIAGYLYTNVSSEKTNLSAQVNSLQKEISTTQKISENQLAESKKEIQSFADRQAYILNSATSKINLEPAGINPNAKAVVYYNEDDSKLLLLSESMPSTEMGKQYQLWAIANGVPVDLGVIAKNNSITDNIDLSQISNVQAFAITLEKDGGSPTPNLEQLYVIGNVNS